MDLGFRMGDLGFVEVREVFSVNEGNTFRVSLDKPRLLILNMDCFDNTSLCQIACLNKLKERLPITCLNK